MRLQFEIEHNGQKMRIDADTHDSDPSVGIFSMWSEDHCILDAETEERRPDLEEKMSDDDWDQIAEKFDNIMNAQPSEFWDGPELYE